jgi:biopolymer transport protein ExbD
MKIPRSMTANSGGSVSFNMTPLIDMVFLLIIFFLVASFYVQRGENQPIELPAAFSAETQNNSQDQKLFITVTKEGLYWIGGNQLDLELVDIQIAEFKQRNQHLLTSNSVIIRGDTHTDFKHIKPLIRICADHRIPFFSFATGRK